MVRMAYCIWAQKLYHRDMSTPYAITNGGKPDGLDEQNYDCTVRALALAAGLPYEVAYIIAEDAGRMPARPFPVKQVLNEYVRQGFGSVDSFYPCSSILKSTVAQFVRDCPKGRYIVRTKTPFKNVGHVFAVVDGVIMDNMPPRLRVRVQSYYFIRTALQEGK